jgi:hypothetical protein
MGWFFTHIIISKLLDGIGILNTMKDLLTGNPKMEFGSTKSHSPSNSEFSIKLHLKFCLWF